MHHIVTLFLYVFSHITNLANVGIVVSLVHDFTDIPVGVVKAMSETIYKNATAAVFIALMVQWFLYRMVLFPYIIYTSTFLMTPDVPTPIIFTFFKYFMITLASLHYFWFVLFINMVTNFAKKGKADDIQSLDTTKKTK